MTTELLAILAGVATFLTVAGFWIWVAIHNRFPWQRRP